MPHRLLTILQLALVLLAAVSLAADPPARSRSGGSRPLLKQLNEETQSLYREVQAGLVRVQLPAPRWAANGPMADADNPLNKWAGQLDPAVCAKLEQEQKQAQKGQVRKFTASVARATATQPATQPSTQHSGGAMGGWNVTISGDETVFRPGASGGALTFDAGGGIDQQGQIVAHGGRIQVNVIAAAAFTPNNIGLLLDNEGHVLVPLFVEKEQFADQEIRVMVGSGEMMTARFLGSDRQTNITVLKLNKPVGLPVKLAPQRPTEGNLTMFLSPNTGVGRLMIWTNELRDWGVVVAMDGGVYGFVRQNQFLSASGCKPVVQQLIRAGSVQRAKLGIAIAEVPQNDAIRERVPVLGTQPAVRVSDVSKDSPAARAGLKTGDLVLALNGHLVGDPSSFAAAVTDSRETATLRVLRNGMEIAVTVELAEK